MRLRKLLLLPALAAAFAVAGPATASADPCIGGPCGADSVSVNIVDGKFILVSTYGKVTCVETISNAGNTTRCGET